MEDELGSTEQIDYKKVLFLHLNRIGLFKSNPVLNESYIEAVEHLENLVAPLMDDKYDRLKKEIEKNYYTQINYLPPKTISDEFGLKVQANPAFDKKSGELHRTLMDLKLRAIMVLLGRKGLLFERTGIAEYLIKQKERPGRKPGGKPKENEPQEIFED